eukprot:6183972-Pleurochrysis_carterae.AAC.1
MSQPCHKAMHPTKSPLTRGQSCTNAALNADLVNGKILVLKHTPTSPMPSFMLHQVLTVKLSKRLSRREPTQNNPAKPSQPRNRPNSHANAAPLYPQAKMSSQRIECIHPLTQAI